MAPKVTVSDFIYQKTLASGAFGRVLLCRKNNTKDFYAVKLLEIDKMKQKNCVETIMNEKAILKDLQSMFIARGLYTFKSPTHLFMVMEYMKGGDLSTLLEDCGYFIEDMARYYVAQLVLALEQLHVGGVIHRDLKPENVLLNKWGHIKLTDFGLSEAGFARKNRELRGIVGRLELDESLRANRSKSFLDPSTNSELPKLMSQQSLQKVISASPKKIKSSGKIANDD